ncbi:uncharacterized mitochondrial protein AtMg00820-like [Aristolochia californica]|uniref:uncharacterized mitochondrial protein AtMg00820-like n=1 Tax=Aristolochia californica TaxID=171875 RepID=UPI0035D55F5D
MDYDFQTVDQPSEDPLSTPTNQSVVESPDDPKSSSSIPTCYEVAFTNSWWKSAMDEEIQAMYHNSTWYLVTLPPRNKAIGCKWVFSLKYNSNGVVVGLVAKGYN